jgi:hypothetical protein
MCTGKGDDHRAVAQRLEDRHAVLVAVHGLAVDQARPYLEVIHSFNHEREAVRYLLLIRDSQMNPKPGWIFALLPRFDKTAWRRGRRP